jgi:hypothetical protein
MFRLALLPLITSYKLASEDCEFNTNVFKTTNHFNPQNTGELTKTRHAPYLTKVYYVNAESKLIFTSIFRVKLNLRFLFFIRYFVIKIKT